MLNVNVPSVLTLEIKDAGLVSVDTSKWSEQFVLQAVRYACRMKVDQARNKDSEASPQAKRDAMAKAVEALETGEWKQAATMAASLTDAEKELRVLLAKEFLKVIKKKTECENMAKGVERWELYRDLVVKPKLVEIATSPEELQELMEKLQLRADNAKFALENRAQRNAEALRKLREEMDAEDE